MEGLGLFAVVAPIAVLLLLAFLIGGYHKHDAQRAIEHAEVMQALLDGAVSRAKILAIVEQLRDEFCGPPAPPDEKGPS